MPVSNARRNRLIAALVVAVALVGATAIAQQSTPIRIAACDTCTPSETTHSKSAAYTSTQTGAAFWTPGAGKKVVVVWAQFQCGGTTAGTVRLWFGASGDTTYTEGTDQPLAFFDCATPSATVRPAFPIELPLPVVASTADHVLRVTTSAAITVDVIAHGYEK